MDDQLFENLAKKYPDLFQKAKVDDFKIGNGWYDLLDTLCDVISREVNYIRSMIKYSIENNQPNIAEREEELEAAVENLPTIIHVKVKFGSLSFYTDGGSKEHECYIQFAENMSTKICEKCGSPGQFRGHGWIKVLCDKHDEEMAKFK